MPEHLLDKVDFCVRNLGSYWAFLFELRHFVHHLGEVLAKVFEDIILILNPFIHELSLLIDILLELSEGALGLLLSRNTILFELCREFLQLCNFSILNLIYLGVFFLLVCGHTTRHRDYPQVFGRGLVNLSVSSLGRRVARVWYMPFHVLLNIIESTGQKTQVVRYIIVKSLFGAKQKFDHEHVLVERAEL